MVEFINLLYFYCISNFKNWLFFFPATIILLYSSFGSEKLKKEFLVPSIAGDLVSCIGISEPDHGSDVAGII